MLKYTTRPGVRNRAYFYYVWKWNPVLCKSYNNQRKGHENERNHLFYNKITKKNKKLNNFNWSSNIYSNNNSYLYVNIIKGEFKKNTATNDNNYCDSYYNTKGYDILLEKKIG